MSPSHSSQSSASATASTTDEILHFVSDHPYFSDDDIINNVNRLIDSESCFLPSSDYFHRCRDRLVGATARQDSITWILKVRAYYKFRPATVFLTINYLDRFLSTHSLPANGWPFQLLSVACLSLAAKMEEVHVPLLQDLQILEPGFIFEPKTVQRMELHVMANLNWRLRSITPFDYLDYFISKLHSYLEPEIYNRVFAASSDLILSTTRVINFLGFRPSTIAAASVLYAAGEILQVPPTDGHLFHEKINKEMVRSCHQLMEEYLIDTCPSARLKDSTAEPSSAPSSPVGVLDAAGCRSCDTCENPSQVEEAEQLAKRPRSSTSDVQ
ncbi:CYCLIN D1 1 [Euphorbia peplus]|nr:CYCLIN D1 1 [Euphorbia peplus]